MLNKKQLLSLSRKKFRDRLGCCIVSGEKTVHDVVATGLTVDQFLVTGPYPVPLKDVPVRQVTVAEFRRITGTVTPQQIGAVIRIPPPAAASGNVRVYCDRISDPGNMGAIIRSCSAFGVHTCYLDRCADPWNTKTIRASAGSVLHSNCVFVSSDVLAGLRNQGWRVVALVPGTGIPLKDLTPQRDVLVFGSEGQGIQEEILRITDLTVRIPIRNTVESLNVACAAAIIMHHCLPVEQRTARSLPGKNVQKG